MSKGSSTWRRLPKRATDFGIGERVRILHGALEGLEGTVRALQTNHRYVLAIDGLPRGVYVLVKDDAIEHVDVSGPS